VQYLAQIFAEQVCGIMMHMSSVSCHQKSHITKMLITVTLCCDELRLQCRDRCSTT